MTKPVKEEHLDQSGEAHFERTSVRKKLPFLESLKAKKAVMQQLDDLGEAPYKRRPRKAPGYTTIDALSRIDFNKEGKKIEHRWLEMFKRSYKLGAYQGQQVVYWLQKRRTKIEEKDMRLVDRIERASRRTHNWRAAPVGSAEPRASASTEVGHFRGRMRFGFIPSPHANIIGQEKRKLLTGPGGRELVHAPRLLRAPDEKEVGPKQVGHSSKQVRKIGVDRPYGYLPAPRPVSSSQESNAQSKSANFKREELRAKGRAAALRAARERARTMENKAKRKSKDDDQR